MADSGLVNAKWVGPFIGSLPDGRQLIPGETVVAVGRDEAQNSAYWAPAGGTVAKDAVPATPAGEPEPPPEESATPPAAEGQGTEAAN